MKKVLLLLMFMAGLGLRPLAAQQHDTFSVLLQDHVEDGLVDYENLCPDRLLPQYIDQLASTVPERLTGRDEKMAFWINAYNAYTLKIICDHYPLDSINKLHTGGLILGSALRSTVWHKKLVTINGEKTSLDHIEHKILRPEFEDARIHFAIVCAAMGCPPLRDEAYEAERLDEQLNDQARVFLSQEEKNSFDRERQAAVISPIFSWFKQDFGGRPAQVLTYLSEFLDPETAAAIREDPGAWRVRYSHYDWSLNEQ